MKNLHDELMDEFSVSSDVSWDVFFQFGENKPIQLATIIDGHRFSITLDSSNNESPEVSFSDGNGNIFKLYMTKCS